MSTHIISALDLVTLVDDQDHVIGQMDKIEAHRGEGKLHRAISVFLFNDQGQLLIQKRSNKKIVGAGQWANTCCGNVRPGESYHGCADRRLREELGITQVDLRPVLKFQYFARCNDLFSEREIDQVFYGTYDGQVTPNPDEVAEFQWVAFEDVYENKAGLDFAPWFVIMLQNKVLVTALLRNI